MELHCYPRKKIEKPLLFGLETYLKSENGPDLNEQTQNHMDRVVNFNESSSRYVSK